MSTTTLTPPPKYNSPFEAQFDPDHAQLFIITNLIRQLHTADLVQVLAVYPTAGKVGFVDVQPMVLDQDTNGIVIAQTPIYKIPYFQLQGGHSAVILAPMAGDIGLAIFAERDITNVVATQKPGAAPTDRTFNTADGLYIGGVLNADPTQWVKFLPTGGIDISAQGPLSLESTSTVSITAGTTLSMTAPGGITQTVGAAVVQLTATAFTSNVPFSAPSISQTSAGGTASFASTITAPDITLPRGSVNNHIHPGVTTGSGNTGNMTL